uniref:Uncharacterized protein n=1 Tax=Aegilops tauschii TaxID=37682 RepID=N1QR01_AEGTA
MAQIHRDLTISGQVSTFPQRNRFAGEQKCSYPARSSSLPDRRRRHGLPQAERERRLPEDSLVEILARVPARSVYRSKCVAKAWRDLIEDPLLRKKLPQTLQGFFFIDKETHRQRVRFTNLLDRSGPLQIDHNLAFLKESPGIGTLDFSDSCNGLLLFEHKLKAWPYDLLGYVVCNPTTKQWAEVPRDGPPLPLYLRHPKRYNYLVFDPSVSSHFHLVQFTWEFVRLVKFEEELVVGHDDDDEEEEEGDEEEELSRTSVHVYSSETGKWTHTQSDWSQIQSGWNKHDLEGWRLQGLIPESFCCAVLNSMLHFIISDEGQIAAVDMQGVTRKIIPVPTMAERLHWLGAGYVAQSQGRLHYISQAVDGRLSIWVLEGYDTQEWVLKHSVSFTELFREKRRTGDTKDYSVVAMHPDGNVVFIVQDWNRKLISYHMDNKLVSIMGTLKNDASDVHVVPYVPCFSESPALENKH